MLSGWSRRAVWEMPAGLVGVWADDVRLSSLEAGSGKGSCSVAAKSLLCTSPYCISQCNQSPKTTPTNIFLLLSLTRSSQKIRQAVNHFVNFAFVSRILHEHEHRVFIGFPPPAQKFYLIFLELFSSGWKFFRACGDRKVSKCKQHTHV